MKKSVVIAVFFLGYFSSVFSDASYGWNGVALWSPQRENGVMEFRHYLRRIISTYGAHRSSPIYGHRHAGIDIKGRYSEKVYAIGKGRVLWVTGEFPNTAIYIQHQGVHEKPFWSVYIHVQGIAVDIGDEVSENTIIGRIFNEDELRRSGFNTRPHLHLEIRHDISDNGRATFECMSKMELNHYCVNPLNALLKERNPNDEQ